MSEDHGLTVEEVPRDRLCLARDGMHYRDHTWWPNEYECGRCGALSRDQETDR